MASAGIISVDVQAKIDNFIKGLNTCTQKAESFSNNLSAKLDGRDYFAPMRESVKGMGKDMRQIAGGIIFAQTFYQTAQAIKAATAAVWEYTDSINYANTTFTNLFRDADLAEEFVSVLQSYAARSPFDFTDVEKAAMQLRSYGIEAQNLMFVMQGIGNLASVTGDYTLTFERVSRAIGQINAKGKLMGEEMRQLAEAGLDVKAVYDKLGTSAQTVADDNIDAATAINAIVDVLNENYAGALDAANMTVRGMVGNIKDLMLMISASIAQPAYDALKVLLYQIATEFNKFQSYFQAGGLRYAIEQYFGPEILQRVEQLISVCMALGQILTTVAAPAFKLVGMYGEALASIISALLTLFLPFVSALAKLVNALMSTAAGARALQAVMMALAAAFIFSKVATLGMMAVQVVQKIIAITTSVVTAATIAQNVYNVALANGATVAVAAGGAYRAFAASLNVNPLVMLLSVVLSLIAAFVGLRSILGGVSSTAASMSTFDASKWLDSVRASSGDINKFNNRLTNTNDQLSDMQDNLANTGKAAKKAVEGLLSFDEVFSLPEANDTATSPGQLGTPSTPGDLGDLGDIGDSLLPDIPTWGDLEGQDWFNDFIDWFKNLDWNQVAGALTAGLAAALENFKKQGIKLLRKVAGLLPEEAGAAVRNIPEQMGKAIVDAFKAGDGKILIEAGNYFGTLPSAILREFNTSIKALPTGVKKLLPGTVESTSNNIVSAIKSIPEKVSAKISGFASNIGSKVSSILEADIKQIPSTLASKIKDAPSRIADKISIIATETPSKVSAKLSSLSSDIATVVASKVTGLPEDIVRQFDVKIKDLPSTIASVLSQRLTGANILAALKDFGKTLGLSLIGDWLFEMVSNGLKENGQASVAGILDEFTNELSVGIATLLVSKNPFAALGAAVTQHIFDSIDESMQTGDWTATVTQITDGIILVASKALKGIGKGGIIGAAASIASDFIFGGISNALEANGDTEAADITSKVGSTVSAGLSGAGLGAMIGSVVPGIGTAIGAAVGAGIGLLLGGLASFWDEISNWWNTTFIPGWNGFWSFGWATADDSWLQVNIVQPIMGTLTGWYESFIIWKDGTLIPAWNSFWSFEWLTADNSWLQVNVVQPIMGTLTGWYESFIAWKDGTLIPAWNSFWSFEWLLPNTTHAEEVTGDAVESDQKSWWDRLSSWWEGIKTAWNDFWSFSWLFPNTAYAQESTGDVVESDQKAWWDSLSNWWNNDVKAGWNDFWSFGWLTDAASTVDTKVLQPVKNGISGWWNNNVAPFWNNTIQPAWSNMWYNMQTAGSNIWSGISSWMNGIQPDIGSKFSGADGWLTYAGNSIMNGLYNGISGMYSMITNAMQNIPSMIIGVFSGAGSWLYNAGVWIVQGLINGLANSFGPVISMVSSWGSAIAAVKGPESYDRKLLIPNGRWITSGLMTGLEKDIPAVLDMMGGLGARMQNAFVAPTLSTDQYTMTLPQSSPIRTFANYATQQTRDAAPQQYSTAESRPIVYVQNMIANKQGIRDLKKQLDIVDAESNRWK